MALPATYTAGDKVLATDMQRVRDLILYAGKLEAFFGGVSDVPNGALLCDGKTIGSASSSATARANADMSTLFALIWNNTSNSDIVIQDSSGTPTTRGASAAADFAANKRIPLPDMRGNLPLGMDNMNASARNRVTAAAADALGGENGAETKNLQHTHSVTGTSNSAGGGGGVVVHSGSTGNGGSTGQDIMPPTLSVRWLIWTGVDW